jgi:hypothetical protein
VSDRTVGRVVRDADLQPHRQQMYLTSHDEAFRQKRDDVLRLYYETPADEHIICLDEMTGMQALERRYADVPMGRGQPVRREFEYIRHGTLCLMGAYDVRERKLFGFASEDHDTRTFVDLLEIAEQCYPEGRGHFVCDNLSMHDTDDVHDWLDEILHAKVLARGSFASRDELCEAVYRFMLWFNGQQAPPFRWSKSWAN